MQKKFGIVVVAAIQVPGQKQQARPGVSNASSRRKLTTQPLTIATAA